MNPAAIILAAGKGTRMRSRVPKALHPVCGRPMVECLVKSARQAGASRIIVVAGHGYEAVRASVPGVSVIRQKDQLGSGHAVNQAAAALRGFSGPVIVLYCDTPLIRPETIQTLLKSSRQNRSDCTLLSVEMERPAGYGRLRRNGFGRVTRIVEEADASDEEKAIREVNVGCYVFNCRKLFAALKAVRRKGPKKEYYLTDAIEILARSGPVEAVRIEDGEETLGVNTRLDLSRAEGVMRRRVMEDLMRRGVGIRDPKTTSIDSDVRIGQDTVLLPHTVIEEGSVIGKNCVIGPFARIRGGSRIGDGAVIGNFVEIVRSSIGPESQIKHLSYIGDTTVGRRVNIGAGTITANFDGKRKHPTVIRDSAQVGSGTVFVAPVVMGRGSKTGAGAVVTKGTRIKAGSVYVGVPAKELRKK